MSSTEISVSDSSECNGNAEILMVPCPEMIKIIPLSFDDQSPAFIESGPDLKQCTVQCLLDVAALEKMCNEQSLRMGTYKHVQFDVEPSESEFEEFKSSGRLIAKQHARKRIVLNDFEADNFSVCSDRKGLKIKSSDERSLILKKIDIRCLQDIASLEKMCVEQNLRMGVYNENSESSDAKSCDSDGSVRSDSSLTCKAFQKCQKDNFE